jgi:hypothetical protein
MPPAAGLCNRGDAPPRCQNAGSRELLAVPQSSLPMVLSFFIGFFFR